MSACCLSELHYERFPCYLLSYYCFFAELSMASDPAYSSPVDYLLELSICYLLPCLRPKVGQSHSIYSNSRSLFDSQKYKDPLNVASAEIGSFQKRLRPTIEFRSD